MINLLHAFTLNFNGTHDHQHHPGAARDDAEAIM
jgi:hypothetical protein